MRVTIIGSLKQRKEIDFYKNLWMNAGCTVISPIERPQDPLYNVIVDYFNHISNSDMVFVVTKPDGKCGNGVTYELAYAKRCGVPVIFDTQFKCMVEYYVEGMDKEE